MNELIVVLFCLQIAAAIITMFTLVLVVLPVKRVLYPIRNLLGVMGTLNLNISSTIDNFRKSTGLVRAHIAQLMILLNRNRKSRFRIFSIKRLLSLLISGKQTIGVLLRLRNERRNRFWTTFRVLMMAGPALVTVMASLKKLLHKPASAG